MCICCKLEEAEFFFEQIKQAAFVKHEPEEHVRCYFSAFLSAIKSLPDYALHDASEYFWLNIDEDAPRIRDAFRDCAKKSSKPEVKAFFKKWEELKKPLEGSPITRLRNINVHRTHIRPYLKMEENLLAENEEIEEEDLYDREVYDPNDPEICGNVLTYYVEDNGKMVPIRCIWFLASEPEIPLFHACNMTLELARPFVKGVLEQFDGTTICMYRHE